MTSYYLTIYTNHVSRKALKWWPHRMSEGGNANGFGSPKFLRKPPYLSPPTHYLEIMFHYHNTNRIFKFLVLSIVARNKNVWCIDRIKGSLFLLLGHISGRLLIVFVSLFLDNKEFASIIYWAVKKLQLKYILFNKGYPYR